MPTAPILPPEIMAQSATSTAAGGPASSANFLMAAADLHASGKLTDPQRSMPKGPATPLATGRKAPRSIKVVK